MIYRGYTAPEYAIHGQLSEKADVYSYGVVVLEIISGQKSSELQIHGEAEGQFLLQKVRKLSQLFEKDFFGLEFQQVILSLLNKPTLLYK